MYTTSGVAQCSSHVLPASCLHWSALSPARYLTAQLIHILLWPNGLCCLFFSLLPSEAETQNINLMNYWDDLFNWYGNLKGLLACSLAKYHGHLAERCPKGTDISISPTEYTLQRMIWKSFLCEEKAHETTLILPPSKTSLCASQHRPTVTAMWSFASHSIVLTQKYHTLFFLLRIDWIRQFEYWQLASQKGKIFPKELQSLRTICNSHSAAYKNELYFLQRCKHLTKKRSGKDRNAVQTTAVLHV